MGVPGLARYIANNFRSAVTQINPQNDPANYDSQGNYIGPPFFTVDNVYIDLNAMAHPAAQQAFCYGAFENILGCKPGTILDMYDILWNTIKENLSIIKPRKMIYLALDGPAPISKMNQQRQRRFMSGKHRLPDRFDSNCLTPGTIVMVELAKYIKTHIRMELQDPHSPFFGCEVIFSPTSIPGEGEHKLVKYIRETEDSKNLSHCIIGPDGDLIMLALAIQLNNVFLFRPNTTGTFDLIDIGRVANELPSKMGLPTRPKELCITDFILLGFLVGNDFLPKIAMFDFLDNGIQTMIDTYKSIYSAEGLTQFQDGRFLINHNIFCLFINTLSKKEAKYLADQGKHGLKYHNNTLMDCIETKHVLEYRRMFNERQDRIVYNIDYKKYRTLYYKKAGIDPNNRLELEKMCKSYIRTIAWVFLYYTSGLPDWEQCYKYHYAPMMTDLAEYMSRWTDLTELYDFELGEPMIPFVQLLAVLPPTSASLLPDVYSDLMLNPKSRLVKSGMYNMEFEIDQEGKLDHSPVILIDFTDIKLVKSEYSKIEKTAPEFFRNKFGDCILFKYNKFSDFRFISEYGNIENCHVRKRIITC